MSVSRKTSSSEMRAARYQPRSLSDAVWGSYSSFQADPGDDWSREQAWVQLLAIIVAVDSNDMETVVGFVDSLYFGRVSKANALGELCTLVISALDARRSQSNRQ